MNAGGDHHEADADAGPARRRLRILFLVHNLGKTRHFDGVIDRLTGRGHTVILAAAAKRNGLKGTGLGSSRRVEVVACPTHRVDRWRHMATQLRLGRDYLRYFEPAYARAGKLAERAASYTPESVKARIEQRPWIRRHASAVGRALELVEAALPSERYFELFIKYHEPDLVIVTPLVDFGSYQTDYVKAAHRLGIPVAFTPFSWDNLTNRGLIRVAPDRIFVWNEAQKREAVDLHRMPADRVVITGAARFDDFMELTPATSREAFCAPLGLDPARPILLYGCSSPFVAPREVEFVRQWIAAIRGSADPLLRDAGILVRPHPVHTDQWNDVSLADLPNVAIWRQPTAMNTDQGLFDSLHHAVALVGLNTSAMLEAAAAGRASFTVLAPEFAGGQKDTLHFHHLRRENGGALVVARDMTEHLQHLQFAVTGDRKLERWARGLVNSFIRPHGIGGRVDRILARELEEMGLKRKRPRRAAIWHFPLRWAFRLVVGLHG